MTPDIEALVARLDADLFKLSTEAAAALREQAREIERLTDDYITHTLACVVADGSEMAKAVDWLASKVERIEAERDSIRTTLATVEAERDEAKKQFEISRLVDRRTGELIATQAATIEGLRKDAERYRWLSAQPGLQISWTVFGIPPYRLPLLSDFDAAIDAALEREESV